MMRVKTFYDEFNIVRVSIFFFKATNRNTGKRCKKLATTTTKKTEQRQWGHSGVFIVNFEHISCLFLLFLLVTLNKLILAEVFKIEATYINLLMKSKNLLPTGVKKERMLIRTSTMVVVGKYDDMFFTQLSNRLLSTILQGWKIFC